MPTNSPRQATLMYPCTTGCASSSLAPISTACSRALRPSLLSNSFCTSFSSRFFPDSSFWMHAAAASCSRPKRTRWSSAERGSLERNLRAREAADPARRTRLNTAAAVASAGSSTSEAGTSLCLWAWAAAIRPK
eukprot:scaffold113434_cov60-Phaeocystis_antarctica.AAC.5